MQRSTAVMRSWLVLLYTFGSFYELDLHDFLWCRLSPPDIQSDQWPCLLQCFHSLTVGHVPDISLVHSQNHIIHPVWNKAQVKHMHKKHWGVWASPSHLTTHIVPPKRIIKCPDAFLLLCWQKVTFCVVSQVQLTESRHHKGKLTINSKL